MAIVLRVGSSDELVLVENALRSLIEDVLRARHGEVWTRHLGVTNERLQKWLERRAESEKTAAGAVVEPRILFYADFTDLWDIMRDSSNWPLFKACFRDQKRLGVYLSRLSELRNPAAHSRALLPYEESLVAGMSGEIRQMITLFRNSGAAGPEPEHFARIEEVTDSFGHRGKGRASGEGAVDTRDAMTLRPGDRVRFRGMARDPRGRVLKWTISVLGRPGFLLGAIRGSAFDTEWVIDEDDIHDQQEVRFTLTSDEGPHRYSDHDDMFGFLYRVFPRT